jgi:ABC-type nitrate/sulfonate/bicarbonate transport system substrate-binding protein
MSDGARSGRSTITVALSTLGSATYASLSVGLLLGAFDDESIELRLLDAGSDTVRAVVSGAADLTGSLTGSAAPVREGRDTTLITKFVGLAGGYVVGTTRIHRVEDCTRVATLGPESTLYLYACTYRAVTGADYEIVSLPDVPSLLDAARSGEVDCLVLGSPATPLLRPELGGSGDMHYVVDIRRPETVPQGVLLFDGALWGMTDRLRAGRNVFVRFLRALRRADDWAKAHSDMEVATLLADDENFRAKYAGIDELVAGVAMNRPQWIPNAGEITEPEWNAVMRALAPVYTHVKPEDPRWSYAARVDMSYLHAATRAPRV